MITDSSSLPSVDTLKKARRNLLWLGIISIVMLFGGLTSGYIVRQGEGKWVEFPLPPSFTISTILIILSSFPMYLAVSEIKKGNRKKMNLALIATILLGIGFIVFQYKGWSELFKNGIAFSSRIKDIKSSFEYIPSGTETVTEAGEAGNVAGSFLYVITGLHIVHLIGGMLALFVVFSRSLLKKYSAENYNGVSMCAIYWHFLAGLWVYLFFFLLYIR